MKILCFGASHVAAIKAGLENILSKEKALTVDFFGITSRLLNEVQITGDCLQLSEQAASNYFFTGNTKVDNFISISSYDTLLFAHESNLLCPQYLYDSNNLSDKIIPQLFSKCCLEKILDRYSAARLSSQIYANFNDLREGRIDLAPLSHYKWINQLFKAFPKKIYFVGRPLPSEHFYPNMYCLSRDSCKIYKSNNRTIRKIAEESITENSAIKFILPPEYLLAKGGFRTKHKYMRNSLSSRGHLHDAKNAQTMDLTHGNALYGSVMAQEILKHLIS